MRQAVFQIVYSKDGVIFIHYYAPHDLGQALMIGHELTRDYVADFFKIIRR